MKKFLIVLAVFVAVAAFAKEMKVLTIGNSFTYSLRAHFAAMAEVQGDKLIIGYANHGGCSIQRHWKYVCEEEADPKVRHYRYQNRKMKLRDMLAAEKWDIVSIQQQSWGGTIPGSFYPEVTGLIAYVKKHAPNAEIVLQQTWAYRIDDNRIKKIGGQREMFMKLYANYQEVAQKFGIRIIPTGLAMEIARENQTEKFVPPTAEAIKAVKMDEKLAQPGSLIVGWFWYNNRKTGKRVFGKDTIHLNNRGKYLQACVWYGFVFGKSPLEIKYVGEGIAAEDADFLKRCAAAALKFTESGKSVPEFTLK